MTLRYASYGFTDAQLKYLEAERRRRGHRSMAETLREIIDVMSGVK